MMNRSSRKNSPEALRFAERRRREDEAPRLAKEVPNLASLRLELADSGGVGSPLRHIRRVLVDRAPAVFVVGCTDPRCVDGDHDLTFAVMRSLRAQQTKFAGSDDCTGTLGPSPCGRVLQFEAFAEYQG
jgi:hypothetical protein